MVEPAAAPDPPLGFPNPPRDRLEFWVWVRVIFGVLFGIFLSGVLIFGAFGSTGTKRKRGCSVDAANGVEL